MTLEQIETRVEELEAVLEANPKDKDAYREMERLLNEHTCEEREGVIVYNSCATKLFAEAAVQALIDLNSPGCAFLDLTHE